jgi:hypothetical protein
MIEEDRYNALVYARRMLKTHVKWREFLKSGGELPHDLIGDLEHQEQVIAEYNVICRVLRRAQREGAPEAETPGAYKLHD